jgi:hypothetical protein
MLKLDLEIKSLKISSSEIEQFLKGQIEEQTKRKVKSIKFDFIERSSGYRDDWPITMFSGCTVEFEPSGLPISTFNR